LFLFTDLLLETKPKHSKTKVNGCVINLGYTAYHNLPGSVVMNTSVVGGLPA
jgi:hypothetical protein